MLNSDRLNEEIMKEASKPLRKDNEPQTTYKPVMRRTYPKAIVGKSGELEDLGSQVVYEETNLVEFTTKDYAIVSSEAVAYLLDVLTPTDYKRFNRVQSLTKTPLNLIYNGQYPHNTRTLREHLNINGKQFERFIRKLTNKGILYVVKGLSPKTGKVQNTYIVNPFISRKRKNIDKELCAIFANVQRLNELNND